ncbi:hypothetical protein HMSSN036_06800 [Paenibacillus macerans]|nr:hypothetical protein HMSSN036_06800 [Paenibacillus macerans]
MGKTRIKPAVTLDDRFSSAARKIGDTLTRLHRTTVKPVAELDDRASKAAVKLYATLAALSAPRWRVSVAGVDWETTVGESFTKWISSDGKSTMQRISASIASALGGGLKDVMMQALGLGDAVKASGAGSLAAAGNTASQIDEKLGKASPAEGSKATENDKKSEGILKGAVDFVKSIGEDVAKDYAKDGLKGLIDRIIGKKDEAQNGKCTCVCICKCGNGGRNSGGRNSGGRNPGERNSGGRRGTNTQGNTGRRVRGNNQNSSGSRTDFGRRTGRVGGSAGRRTLGRGSIGQMGLGLLMDTGIDLLTEKGPGLLEGVKNFAGKSASWVGENGPKLLEKGKSLIGGKVPNLMELGKSLTDVSGLTSLVKGAGWLGKGRSSSAKLTRSSRACGRCGRDSICGFE